MGVGVHCDAPPEGPPVASGCETPPKRLGGIVVCTHIPGQTYLESQRSLMPYDIVKKVNRTKIRNITHFTEVLQGLAESIEENQYILLETERTNVYLDLKKIAAQEVLLQEKFQDQIFAAPRKRRRLR